MKIISENYNDTNQRIYNVTSFNPSAKEFYNLLKNYFKDAKISYKINEVRQRIVDSWPNNIDDSIERKEWGWEPIFDLNNVINNYLIQGNKIPNENH